MYFADKILQEREKGKRVQYITSRDNFERESEREFEQQLRRVVM